MNNDENETNLCEEYQILMMGYIDGELGPEDEDRFKAHAYKCSKCAKELIEYQKLAELTNSLQIKEPADYEWERIYKNIFYKMESRFSWSMIIAGVIVIFGWLMYEICVGMEMATWLRVGIVLVVMGFMAKLIFAFRKRIRIKKYERYEAVKR